MARFLSACLILILMCACTITKTDVVTMPVTHTVKTETPLATTTLVLPQQTAVSTKTAIVTNTPVPTPIPTPTTTPTPSALSGPLVAFDAINLDGQGVILIFDTVTGIGRELTSEQLGGSIVGFDWSQNGCDLFVAIQDSGSVQYISTDLAGNVSTPLSQLITVEGSRYAWTISSTKEWIAFLVGLGEDEEGFDFQFKDTWVVKNNSENIVPIALTHNSWTLEPIWSPIGDRLAFTKHDSMGIPQLYHAAPDGSDLVQLTHFSEPIDHIKGIRWSPDGYWLSFSTYYEADALAPGESSLWSVANDGQNLVRVDLGDFIIRQSPWWSDDSASYSAYVELWAEEIRRGFQSGKVIWVNPQNGTITHEFIPNEIKFEHVFPVGGNEVIGFLGTSYERYDKVTETVHEVGASPFGAVFPREVTPLIGPYDFEGEVKCH